jgi:1,2-diacylglycerol 3-alpha-glucosyltransferase
MHICLSGTYNDNWNYQDNILTKYHRKMGNEVSIVASKWIWDNNGKMIKTIEEDNYRNENDVEIFRLNILGRDKQNRKFKRFQNLIRVINKWNADILFIHGPQFIDIHTIKNYLVHNTHIKVVVDNHADRMNSGKSFLSKYVLHKVIWKILIKRIEPYVIKFYGVLPSRVDFMREMYGVNNKKLDLLLLGADDELVEKTIVKTNTSDIRKICGVEKEDFFIITGGKIDKNKTQILTLMDAINKIENKNIKLVVFGSISNFIENEFKNKLSKKVTFIGWLNPIDTYKFFYSADLVVFPGLHSVLWEQAVSLGKVCIFKYIPGFNHIDLGGNCLFFENDSLNEIINKVSIVSNDKSKFAEMQSMAKSKAMNFFSYAKISKKSIQFDDK